MAVLITAVRKEIAKLQKDIEQQTVVLRELTNELKKHEKVVSMLENGAVPREAARRKKPGKEKGKGKAKSNGRTNWNSLLEGLPRSFTAGQVRQAAGEASNQADVHQALLRWRRAGKIKTSERGKYRKTAAAAS